MEHEACPRTDGLRGLKTPAKPPEYVARFHSWARRAYQTPDLIAPHLVTCRGGAITINDRQEHTSCALDTAASFSELPSSLPSCIQTDGRPNFVQELSPRRPRSTRRSSRACAGGPSVRPAAAARSR